MTSAETQKKSIGWIVAAAGAAAIFIFDLLTPLGIAVSMLYVLPILLTRYIPGWQGTVFLGGGIFILTWVPLVLPFDNVAPQVAGNRVMTSFLLFVVAGLLLKEKYLTQQRAADETALRESEERFRTMAQAVPSFLFETDAEGWNIWTSEGWCRFTGQTPHEVSGHGWAEALHPDDRAANIDRWMQCLKDGVPFESQQRLRRRDGVYVWVVARALPVRDNQGKVTRWVGSVTNVDDIVRAQEALCESEERLQLFIEHAPSALAMCDRNMRYLAVSRRWMDDYGLGGSLTTIIGRSHYDVFPEIPDRWKDVHQRGLAGEVVQEEEDRFERAGGSVQWLRWEVRPWRLRDGQVGGIVIFTEDITERKESEERLRLLNDSLEARVRERTAALAEANERWDWVVRATNDGVWDWDLVHDTAYFSPRWKEMHGFQTSDRTESTKEWLARIHPDDRARVLAALNRCHAGKGSQFYEEYRVQKKDGTYFWVLDRGLTIFNGQGRASRMIGAESDITWRKEAEESLRRREHEFRTLADNVPAFFSYIDRGRRYRFVNKRYEELFGRSDQELSGVPIQDLLGSDGYAQVQLYLERALAGELVSFEYELKTSGNGTGYWAGQYVPDRDEQGQVTGVFALITDITVLKSSEALLREREAQLRELSARLLRAQEEERRRISRDLHDDVMQRMGALALELYGLASSTSSQDSGLLQSQLKACGASAEQLTTDCNG